MNEIKKWSKEWGKSEDGKRFFANAQKRYRKRKIAKNPNWYKEQHRKDNILRVRKNRRDWRKKNPESVKKSFIKLYEKLGNVLEMNRTEYEWALKCWSLAVRERDGNVCLYCGSTRNLQGHHQYSKKDYPELSLDLNNGFTLCLDCHKNTESWGDCSFR